VIANGAIQPLDLDNSTTAAQLTEAIDWATAENARPGSKHEGKLDTALQPAPSGAKPPPLPPRPTTPKPAAPLSASSSATSADFFSAQSTLPSAPTASTTGPTK
jgi:hypothetical protein